MAFFSLMIFLGIFIFHRLFHKKLVCLLSLELMMVSLIVMFILFGISNLGEKSSFIGFFFTCFMVLDSILGISFLICSSRASYIFSSSLF